MPPCSIAVGTEHRPEFCNYSHTQGLSPFWVRTLPFGIEQCGPKTALAPVVTYILQWTSEIIYHNLNKQKENRCLQQPVRKPGRDMEI